MVVVCAIWTPEREAGIVWAWLGGGEHEQADGTGSDTEVTRHGDYSRPSETDTSVSSPNHGPGSEERTENAHHPEEIVMNASVRLVVVASLLLAPTNALAQVATPQSASTDTASRIQPTARVTGSVREPGGRPVAHVRVTVIGLGRDTRTTARGTFVLDSLPAATFTLEAVRIGSTPGRTVVELKAGATTAADITLGKGLVVLETREITDQWVSEIERRARISTSGYFVKPAEIAARGRNTPLAALLYQVPSLKVGCARPSQCSVTMRAGTTPQLGARYCTPSLYIDGFRDRFADFASIYSGDILAIEVYRELGRPFEFLDDNRCGAVAVWTKPLEPRKKKLF